ncbi:MAG: ATP-dependent DNA helicase UvrD2, partial [Actinobacteria bacterium]|nr:ATP-dependent DNA helicase UvrD2 [Actinomycetota bacterium]
GATADALLAGLDASQRDAVVQTARPLAILAGAGSGKTRVLTRRIAWQAATAQLDLDRVLAVTFTRKAAGELVRRLERLPGGGRVTAGTFHALALAQLRRRWREHGHPAPVLLEHKARVLVPLIGPRGGAAAPAVASEIEWAKARLLDPEHYPSAARAEGRATVMAADEVAAVFAAYEQHKQRRRLVDFDDLIVLCVRALDNDGDFAAAQRFRFRHFFVDEFQDVTPAQLRLLRAWLGPRDDLCAVGDPDQAIYRFAGAEPDYLRRFGEHFRCATVVRLPRNYRSTPQVVATARAALGASAAGRVDPVRASGPEPVFCAHDTDRDEARAVAKAARDAHAAGCPWGSIAVLYRTNAQSALFEEAFARLDMRVRVRGGSRFVERPEVFAVLELLRAGARRFPAERFTDHLIDLDTDTQAMPEQQREHTAAIVALGREYAMHDGAGGSVDGFIAWLRATFHSGDAGFDGDDAVDLLTFHRAKGLEYETVFVCGVERGFVPIAHATNPAAAEEERRLFYVALSRAGRALHVTWARRRTLGAQLMDREPSPWLPVILAAGNAATDAFETAVAPGVAATAALEEARALLASRPVPNPRRRVAGVRSVPVGVRDDGDGLLDALREWRGRVAHASAVPAFAIATDRTLRAIADARPASVDALSELEGIGPARLARYGRQLLEIVARVTP